jgi:MFS family permease
MIADPASALSSRNYRKFLLGNFLSVLGVWIQRLALGWHAWQLSESALIVGVTAAAQFVPAVVLTPFFGVVVDQVSTRGAAVVLHIFLAGVAALLALLTLSGHMSTEWLIGLALANGIVQSAYSPVRLALIPDLVRKAQFPSAVAISSMAFNFSRFLGPGIAGTVVALYGLGYAYLINAITYLPIIFILMILRVAPHEPHPANQKSYVAQLMEGLRYARDHAPIRQVILLAAVSNFFGRGIVEIMPAFAALIFDGGSSALAALMASAGVGAIGASLLFGIRSLHTELHWLVVIGAIGVALSMLLFATVSTLTAGVLVVMLMGLFASLVAIGSQTEVQIHVENRLRGRVMSLWSLVIMGGPAIGSVVAGALAGSVGSTWTSASFGIASLLLIALVGVGKPAPPAN